jgi:hypothetical protein
MSKKIKKNKSTKNNVVNVDFGTTQPNTTKVDEKQLEEQVQMMNTLISIGQSTLEWAVYATRDEFINHMNKLYDIYHPEEQSKIVAPKKEIILPN